MLGVKQSIVVDLCDSKVYDWLSNTVWLDGQMNRLLTMEMLASQ